MFTLPPSTHDVQFKESMQSIIFPSPFPGPTHRRAPFLGTKTSRLVLWPLVGRCLSAMGRSVALDGVTISHHRIPEELGGGVEWTWCTKRRTCTCAAGRGVQSPLDKTTGGSIFLQLTGASFPAGS
jgi:hypothetical protein